MSLKKAIGLSFALLFWLTFGGVDKSLAGSFTISRSPQGDINDSSVYPAKSSATASASSMLISSGTVILYGIHVASNSVLSGSWVTFRDTDVVSFVATVPTTTVVGFSSTTEQRIQFNPPLRFYRGLNVTATASVCANAVPGWCYTVLYDTVP